MQAAASTRRGPCASQAGSGVWVPGVHPALWGKDATLCVAGKVSITDSELAWRHSLAKGGAIDDLGKDNNPMA